MRKIKFDYIPFFQTLKEKGISQNKLITEHEVSNALMDRLRHNKNMTMLTLVELMRILDITDVSKVVNISAEEE